MRDVILERLGRRYTAQRNEEDFAACARLLAAAPANDDADRIVAGMEKGMAGVPLAKMPASIAPQIDRLWARTSHAVP